MKTFLDSLSICLRHRKSNPLPLSRSLSQPGVLQRRRSADVPVDQGPDQSADQQRLSPDSANWTSQWASQLTERQTRQQGRSAGLNCRLVTVSKTNQMDHPTGRLSLALWPIWRAIVAYGASAISQKSTEPRRRGPVRISRGPMERRNVRRAAVTAQHHAVRRVFVLRSEAGRPQLRRQRRKEKSASKRNFEWQNCEPE